MDDPLSSIHESIQDSLDIIVSARSSTTARSRALENLQHLIVQIFGTPGGSPALPEFLSLQNTFECNVASRILSWISVASLRLDVLLQRGISDINLLGQNQAQCSVLNSQLTQALSVIQGVALTHHPTKAFLGRKYSLEVLLDLFIISRQLASPSLGSKQPTPSDDALTCTEEAVSPSALPNAVLDTLLCILVDSSRSLRVFEDCDGVQTIVKLLKRARTPRDVRMKCLEFLYFYLMDEPPSRSDLSASNIEPVHLPPVSLSPSPFGSLAESRYFPQSSRNASSSSDDSLTFSGGSSRSSSSSMLSSTSLTSSSTPAHIKPSSTRPKTPPSPTKPSTHLSAKPRALLMLQREVDFMPVTPKNSHGSRLNDAPRPSSAPNSPFKNFRAIPDFDDVETRHSSDAASFGVERHHATHRLEDRDAIKTTEQKKESLGFMLGNVDALVEGVKRAGVWGLA
ncbi:CDC14-domain-containing protein [Russula earlei]|uniref:CDC14-domain-containing protein n=1 Tax=Russula earlei TaxID=71964 RepID=A0ACC0UQK4_9AGAM|nr:CDC14-domain-containing protein [Russula earlei]